MKIHELLREDLVLLDLKSRDRDGALQEIESFLKSARTDLSDKNVYDELLRREKLGSTAVREGYAIPHCRMRAVNPPVVSLAVSKSGIDFESVDGKPSSVFFVVITSAEHPSLNIQILAGLAQLMRKSRHLLKKISHARTGKEIVAAIREEEEKSL